MTIAFMLDKPRTRNRIYRLSRGARECALSGGLPANILVLKGHAQRREYMEPTMQKQAFRTMKAEGVQRTLNARKDPPDIRDRMYEPALIQLQPHLDNRSSVSKILDQGQEGACTGFGLAAVINLLNARTRSLEFSASTRMLYELAKKHDEWPGEDYAGSSCRGAIRGWKNMGVCSEEDWPYAADQLGGLTIERARAARSHPLGAYYRLRPEINDYHAALNEVGAIYVSADVHSGWSNPRRAARSDLALIRPSDRQTGGHAFAIVGYDERGFIVQNSWGPGWGSKGFALWLYEDWLDNVNDGWVFRLAIPTPQIFGLTARSLVTYGAEAGRGAPKRLEIAGHFVHFDDGSFKPRGDYWSTLDDVQKTADLIRSSVDQKKYDHLLIYAHGGLNSPEDSARRVAALKEGFKRNRIYPFHIMYDTGLAEEVKDSVLRAFTGRRMEGFFGDLQERLTDQSDTLIEDVVRKPVTPVWDEMKRDARLPFDVGSAGVVADGLAVIRTFAQALQGTGIQIHLAGHSTGGVLVGHLLNALDTLALPDLIRSCSLMAPACTLEFFESHYAPRLGDGAGAGIARLPVLDIYNLTDKLERDDNVAKVYRKSLLYLVSRALERRLDKPILGMQRYTEKLDQKPGLTIHYSHGEKGKITRSTSHGGFDNDSFTMNSILERILGHEPKLPFQDKEMEGY
jgi:hypothetical protein